MTLRVGVCGTAHWAEVLHLPGLQQAPGVCLAGVQGRNAARVAALAAAFDVPGFATLEDMLPHVDAVAFSVPPVVQVGLAVTAVRAGKMLLLEKPPATTVADAARLGGAILQAGVAATCFLTRRFIPEIMAFAAAARQQGAEAGSVIMRSGALAPESPYAVSVWRQAPGAALWDLGPHALTQLIAMFGPVASIAATSEPDAAGDAILLALRHAGGASSRAELDLRSPPELRHDECSYTAGGHPHVLQRAASPRLDPYFRCVAALLDGAETEHRADVAMAALAMVPVLCAAETSLAAGGEPVLVR